jgi:formylglycine-generating enzyme required for sulfatase activity
MLAGVSCASRLVALMPLSLLVACGHAAMDTGGTIPIPAGHFTMGSSPYDRALALEDGARYGADLRAGIEALRAEQPERRVASAAFSIMVDAVTQAEYAAYVYATGAPEPWVDPVVWSRTPHRKGAKPERVQWEHGRPREARMDQPAVLVSQPEAEAYCRWWGDRRGGLGALPSEAEWERAARGDDGRIYPWGTRFEPTRANTRESGRGDLHAVGSDAGATSPFGVQGMAGNVAEWTSSFERDLVVVKGAAYDDDLFAARAAARSLRAPVIRHVAIGFRCVLDPVR